LRIAVFVYRRLTGPAFPSCTRVGYSVARWSAFSPSFGHFRVLAPILVECFHTFSPYRSCRPLPPNLADGRISLYACLLSPQLADSNHAKKRPYIEKFPDRKISFLLSEEPPVRIDLIWFVNPLPGHRFCCNSPSFRASLLCRSDDLLFLLPLDWFHLANFNLSVCARASSFDMTECIFFRL